MVRTPGRHQEVHTPPPTRDLDDGTGVTPCHHREPVGEPPPPLPVVHPHGVELEYARALIGGGFPKLPEEKVEELVEARVARRALFDRGEPTAMIELILEESAPRRPFGSWEVLRDQSRSLAADAERDNVSVQVLPLERGVRGGHAGAAGSMVLVKTKEHHDVVYLEIEEESLLVSEPAKVARLTHRYAKIRTQALSPDDSLSLIRELAGEERT
ncbi:DUF5753 domain-containing protein [Streptomyces sp. 900105755]